MPELGAEKSLKVHRFNSHTELFSSIEHTQTHTDTQHIHTELCELCIYTHTERVAS